jgi:hypothetical protein
MVKDLSALRAERSTARPERPYKVIVGDGQKYVTEIARLTAEHDELLAQPQPDDKENPRPRKLGGQTLPPRVLEIRDRLAELADLMREYEGEVLVRATLTDGEWEQWRIAHPAREEDQPGHRDDLMIARGYCNADDLMDDLARFVVAWEGEELQPGDYDALNLLRPDKKALAATVVGLYEVGDDLGKFLSDLSALLRSEPPSNSPEHSGSPRSASTAGSPSNTTSTSTTTPAA